MPGYELVGAAELAEIQDIFNNGGVLFRHGFDQQRNGRYKVRQFEEAFAQKMNVNEALAVSSGTAALRVILAALGIQSGDKVITQAFTFVATVEAIVESGAQPVGCDVDLTLNMDPLSLEKLIDERTKAVIVVHMLGTPAKLEQISEICKRKNIYLVEDTAWGLGGMLHGQKLGTWGDAAAFSFDYAKTITTGEGGMVTFKNPEFMHRAQAWHDHGHENNPQVPRWEDTRSASGFNFRMSELQGAIGLVQLTKLDFIIEKQREIFRKVWAGLSHLKGVELRESEPGAFETYDAIVFFVEGPEIALNCRRLLLQIGVSTKILPEAYTWHFMGCWDHIASLASQDKVPLNERFLPSEKILRRAVSIPVFLNMDSSLPERICNAICSAVKS